MFISEIIVPRFLMPEAEVNKKLYSKHEEVFVWNRSMKIPTEINKFNWNLKVVIYINISESELRIQNHRKNTYLRGL